MATKAAPNEVDRIITEHGRICPLFLRFFLSQKVSQQLLSKARKSRKNLMPPLNNHEGLALRGLFPWKLFRKRKRNFFLE